MNLSFTKMHGLGNDFAVIDATQTPVQLSPQLIRAMADRRTGIGFDQLLMIAAPTNQHADFEYRIFNADGGEVGQCGNGARCVALFIRQFGLSQNDQIVLQTVKGLLTLSFVGQDVQVDMGRPDFLPAKIPLEAKAMSDIYVIDIDGVPLEVSAVGMGNPHAVLLVDKIDDAYFLEIGRKLTAHQRFPEGVNVNFVELQDRTHVHLKVFERGAGPTLACGSGACAAMVAMRARQLVDQEVVITQPGGDCRVVWAGEGDTVKLIGPAKMVYQGHWVAEN